MSEPVVIFVNLRRTQLEHGAAIEAAHRLGYGVALIADTVPAGLPTGIVRTVQKVDTYDAAAVDAAVDVIAAEHPVAGVVTWSDRDVSTVSRIAGRLGLLAPSTEAARIARNKYLMREALADHPDTIPRFARITTWDDVVKVADDVGFPAVLKPTSGSGSKGIFVVRDHDQLRAAFDELIRYTRPEVDRVFLENPNELILEEFLVGSEHSIEGFVRDGTVIIAGVTDKQTSEPFRLEIEHTFPSSLSETALAAVHELTRTVVAAMRLDNATFHLEAMVSPEGTAKLVEIAARVGGDFITSHLVGLATGRSFAENVIRVATGQQPELGTGRPLYSGVRKIMAARSGVLDGVDGLAAALAVPGVRHVVVERAVGAKVALPPADYMSSTIGAVIAVGDSADAVRRTLAQAVDAVDVRITET
jgi:biotin carboxylase